MNVEEKEEEDREFFHIINSSRQPHVVRPGIITNMPSMPEGSFYSIIIIIITSRLADLLNTGGVLYYMAFLPMRSPQKNEKRETSRIEKLTTAIALREKKISVRSWMHWKIDTAWISYEVVQKTTRGG